LERKDDWEGPPPSRGGAMKGEKMDRRRKQKKSCVKREKKFLDGGKGVLDREMQHPRR